MGLEESLVGYRTYLDSNVFIYALKGAEPFGTPLRNLFKMMDDARIESISSELVLAEVLVGPFRNRNLEEERQCRRFLRPRRGLKLCSVSSEILEQSARLRAQHSRLRTPDAIHLATAELTRCEIFLTNDLKLASLGSIEVIPLSSLLSPPLGPAPDPLPPAR